MTASKHIEKLNNAPLQEVIFDVKWDLEVLEGATLNDPRFVLASGIFFQAVKKSFPISENMSSDAIPLSLLAYKPKYRFRSGQETFPLVHLGPGMMSLHDNDENYVWQKTYKPNIELTLDALFASYESELQISEITLRYIDAVEIPPESAPTEFIQDCLRINIQRDFQKPGKVQDINYGEQSLLDDGSYLAIGVSTGKRSEDNTAVLLWQTAVSINQNKNRKGIGEWVEHAHEITSNLFKKMVSPKYYESFT